MLFSEPNTQNSPEKVRLGVNLKSTPRNTHRTQRPGVRHADGSSQEVGVLAKIERRGQHHHAEIGRQSTTLAAAAELPLKLSKKSPRAGTRC